MARGGLGFKPSTEPPPGARSGNSSYMYPNAATKSPLWSPITAPPDDLSKASTGDWTSWSFSGQKMPIYPNDVEGDSFKVTVVTLEPQRSALSLPSDTNIRDTVSDYSEGTYTIHSTTEATFLSQAQVLGAGDSPKNMAISSSLPINWQPTGISFTISTPTENMIQPLNPETLHEHLMHSKSLGSNEEVLPVETPRNGAQESPLDYGGPLSNLQHNEPSIHIQPLESITTNNIYEAKAAAVTTTGHEEEEPFTSALNTFVSITSFQGTETSLFPSQSTDTIAPTAQATTTGYPRSLNNNEPTMAQSRSWQRLPRQSWISIMGAISGAAVVFACIIFLHRPCHRWIRKLGKSKIADVQVSQGQGDRVIQRMPPYLENPEISRFSADSSYFG